MDRVSEPICNKMNRIIDLNLNYRQA
ncbi:uncharacterized protein METZ01_LOCUS138632 [marine metagenome]|uniref:Uncharacterized protein n=1 Tax=marine metagenome TaxID=408172 RepID=A0A381Z933_9ZZZZ